MEPEMKRDGYMRTHDSTVSMYNTLLYMMVKGLRVDRETLEKTRVDIQAQARRPLRKNSTDLAGRPLNALSPKQCKEYLYLYKGARPLISLKPGPSLPMTWLLHGYGVDTIGRRSKSCKMCELLISSGSGYLDVELDPDDTSPLLLQSQRYQVWPPFIKRDCYGNRSQYAKP